MNKTNIIKGFFLIFFSTIFLMPSFAVKDFIFTYDAAGNRIQRSAPTLRKANIENEKQQEVIKDSSIEDNEISIFPNPTAGNLSIDISSLEEEQLTSLVLMDTKGRVLITRSNLSASNSLDITSFPSATYVLKIMIDKQSTEWKIIKK